MTQVWLMEMVKGIGGMFLHPVFYYSFFLAAILGVSRVKRERQNFTVRSENAYFELRQLLPLGLIIGLGISIVSIGAGLVIPFATILFIAALTILLSLTTKIRLLSPAYTVGFAFFLTIFAGGEQWAVPFFETAFDQLDEKIYPAIAGVIALLLIGEGLLIYLNGKKGTSPRLIKSKRGLRVGVHEVKRVWLLPVFLVIPGSVLEAPFEWWPVFTAGGESYSLLLVPFAVGFHQQIQSILPVQGVQLLGKRVMILGVLLTLISIGTYWLPILSIAVVALAIGGRELLSIWQKVSDDNSPFYFSKKDHGLMILGVLPESPASKMALSVGEMITKVNGTPINDEKTFYEMLQKNRAHCRLEVVDVNGEIRFVQRALYEGDHHELGILFVQEERKWDTEAM